MCVCGGDWLGESRGLQCTNIHMNKRPHIPPKYVIMFNR